MGNRAILFIPTLIVRSARLIKNTVQALKYPSADAVTQNVLVWIAHENRQFQ